MKTNNKSAVTTVAATLLSISLCWCSRAASVEPFLDENTKPQGTVRPIDAQWLNTIPRGFIPNVGQLPNESVKFALRDSGVSAYFTDQGFVLWNGHTTTITRDGAEVKVPVAPRWELVGARPVQPVGGESFPHTVSFFRGNDPTKWHANTPAYRDLRYPEILNGVELRVESRERGFEYSFHVQPHAKPDLRFRYDGITALEKSLSGDLIVRTAKGHFTESRPVSFQFIDGTKRDVESWFELVSANEYRIDIGAYDERHELIIDPVLDWSTSVGGSYGDQLNVVKVDPFGDVVVAGVSHSVNLPTTSGFAPFGTDPGENFGSDPQWPEHSDIYIAKFSADGTQLRWAGYLGGEGATPESIGRNKTLAVDSAGDVYITTHTRSADFPVWPVGNSFHQGEADVSITRIKADGSAIIWSRLLGHTYEDYGYAVAVHGHDLYLSGVTTSPNFPATRMFAGMQDAFVAKLNTVDGVVAWAAFLGGSLEERISALAADASGVIVFGDTDSADFHALDFPAPTGHDRTLGGNNDTFLTKFSSAGVILWSTYLGGSGAETTDLTPIQGFPLTWGLSDMTLDSAGNIVAAGHTYSTDFPNTAGRFQPTLVGSMDAYVAKLAPDGSQVLWATYLGGSGPHDRAASVAVNPWDEILIGGGTSSLNFPTTADALKPTMQADGFQDGFLAKLDRDGQQVLYSTYIGNNGWHDAVLALDCSFGNVMIGGWHFDTFFQITQGTFRQECDNCGHETFLMKLLDAFIAHDGFESGNYSGGEGDWADDWTVSGDIIRTNQDGPHSGTQHVRLRSSTGDLQRTINLPPATTSARLGFWAKVNSFEGSDQAHVFVTGSASPIASFTSAQSDNQYHYYEIDLTDYLSSGPLTITFDAAMSASNDQIYLDDIRITGSSSPVPPVANAGTDQVINADISGFATVTLDGALSSDPDGGSIVSFEWKEGTIVLGTGAIINTSLAVGVHTITLTVSDDEGATASDDIQISVNAPPPPPANPLHSGDLDGSSANAGKNWKATVVVTIHDGNHAPAQGATVSIQWSAGASGTASATTDANGRCTFISGSISKQSSSATLTIASVSYATLTYSAAANHDPDGDSNGTSITVNKP